MLGHIIFCGAKALHDSKAGQSRDISESLDNVYINL